MVSFLQKSSYCANSLHNFLQADLLFVGSILPIIRKQSCLYQLSCAGSAFSNLSQSSCAGFSAA